MEPGSTNGSLSMSFLFDVLSNTFLHSIMRDANWRSRVFKSCGESVLDYFEKIDTIEIEVKKNNTELVDASDKKRSFEQKWTFKKEGC